MVSIASSADEYEYEYEYDCDECELDAVTLPPRFTEHRLDHHNDPARQAAEALHQVARDLTGRPVWWRLSFMATSDWVALSSVTDDMAVGAVRHM